MMEVCSKTEESPGAQWGTILAAGRPKIRGNGRLREPQEEAVVALYFHFRETREPALVQIPVGCGKTGLMAILPFALSRGKTLIVSPNVTIREAIFAAVDPGSGKCFWRAAGVAPMRPQGPFAAHLDGPDASLSDCRESHFVVANVQQLATKNNRWLAQFPTDFFDLILFDEGHHNAAASWRRLREHFPNARLVSVTATPFRSDGKKVVGKTVYRYPFLRAMARSYIKKLRAVHVMPGEIAFTTDRGERRCTLEEIMKLKESSWFSRGVALAPECNRHIVAASVRELQKLRQESGGNQQIIAVACSVEHAEQVAELFREAGLRAQEIHSKQPKQQREAILTRLRNDQLDVIVQVEMLGEGFDHPPLAVAAVFRPFRSLSPYIQFIGRIMRVLRPGCPGDAANQGVVVSHVGLNTQRLWADFKLLDEADQHLWSGLIGEKPQSSEGKPAGGNATDPSQQPQRFSPEMLVAWEVLKEYQQSSYGPGDGSQQQQPLLDVRSTRGTTAGPQQRRRQARSKLQSEVDQAIRGLLAAHRLSGVGQQVRRKHRSLGFQNNWISLRFWIYRELQQAVRGRREKRRAWDLEETEQALEAMPAILENIDQSLQESLGRKKQWPKSVESSSMSMSN